MKIIDLSWKAGDIELLRLLPTPNPLGKTFKSDQCVICLEEEPKVLLCDCGHICICKKCILLNRYNKCPVCKERSTILRIIE